ncbi:type 4a pilus biogenesis protein PilO [Ammonifex degensii]|uniref:type 4a pilus biogenesis protein PilO n=1 Tax=Ammonifex degensii TaxID=42838 RepID=UPI00145F5035|nr:type 4a pilus biogenesis protein PilO [Ammonifex degensii]
MRRVLLLALLGALGVFLLVWFLFLPQWRAYARTREDLQKAQSELTRYQQLLAARPWEEKRVEELRRDPLLNFFTLDARQGTDVVLLGLQAAVRKVRVVSFEPGQVVEKQYVLALPLQIGVEGSYPDVLSFVEGLETGAIRNLVEIRSFKLSGQESTPGTVRGDFAAVLYMDKNPQARLMLEQVGGWALGRPNLFQPLFPQSQQPLQGKPPGETGEKAEGHNLPREPIRQEG